MRAGGEGWGIISTVLEAVQSMLYRLALPSFPIIHCNEIRYVFPEMKLRGHVPNFYIYVSVSDLYIPRIGLLFGYSKIVRPILGKYKSLADTWMWNWKTEHYNSVLEITRPRFHFWEYTNWNQTFILFTIPAQQQACQPVTKDEYCINTVEKFFLNKHKECREGTKIK